MQAALRLTGTVQPGGRVEVASPHLPPGTTVDVIILLPQKTDIARRSVTDVLAKAPGRLAFQNAEEVDAHIREERDAWNH